MENISYDALEEIGYKGYLLPKDAPEKVLQFGEGNFLRAFVDRFFDMGNEATGWNGKVVMVQPISGAFGFADGINAQDDLYTVLVRGKENGNTVDESRVISACSRCINPYREDDYRAMMEVAVSDDLEIIVSNTTEPVSPTTRPARPTTCRPRASPPSLPRCSTPAGRRQAGRHRARLRAHRSQRRGAAAHHEPVRERLGLGGRVLAVDGQRLHRLHHACRHYPSPAASATPRRPLPWPSAWATRIPSWPCASPSRCGHPGDESLAEKLPFVKAGLPGVFVTPDVTPYKKRKVRILNGAHTAFVPGSWVAGFDIVRDCMHDETVRGFMNTMLYDEVIPTLAADLDVEDCKAFAAAVENRFDNPFIDHALLSICLNSTAKWRARDLPTLKDYVAKTGSLPKCLATSLATLIAFYTQELVAREGDGLHLRRADGTEYTAQDDAFVLDFYAAHAGTDDAELVHDVLTNEQMWGENLTQIAGLEEFVVGALAVVRTEGAKQAFANAQA